MEYIYGPVQCYDVWNVVDHGFPVWMERGPIRVYDLARPVEPGSHAGSVARPSPRRREAFILSMRGNTHRARAAFGNMGHHTV
jgi:hypothetical protein